VGGLGGGGGGGGGGGRAQRMAGAKVCDSFSSLRDPLVRIRAVAPLRAHGVIIGQPYISMHPSEKVTHRQFFSTPR